MSFAASTSYHNKSRLTISSGGINNFIRRQVNERSACMMT
nr:MAG TPA: hypothetical protein [Caudoviricetes sp.]